MCQKKITFLLYSYNIFILLKTKIKGQKNYFFFLKKKDKCKISPCSLPKLQIAPCKIKNNSAIFRVGQKNNLVLAVKFRQNT